MTQVSQNSFHSIPAVAIAVAKLKTLQRAAADGAALPAELTLEDVEALIEHCESTMGNFQLPDVPM